MATPKQAEILINLIARLKGDAGIIALVGTSIYNHVPQDKAFPYIKCRWSNPSEWDTKDSEGFDGDLVVDIWSKEKGDLPVLVILDAVHEALHNKPFTPVVGQGLLLQFRTGTNFVEPDGVTHHGVAFYRYIVTD